MLKLGLFSLKPSDTLSNGDSVQRRRAGPAELRITKDLDELTLPTNCSMSPPEDILDFRISISPDEGFYKSGTFEFSFKIPAEYPYEPPKVNCHTRVYHPNIDSEGNVCLNILREDWKPVLTINTIVLGLIYLFLSPNPDDPLNQEAAQELKTDQNAFARKVMETIGGQYRRPRY